MQTPAGRASGLGRPVPQQAGGFGPPGSGDTHGAMPPTAASAPYTDDDFVKPRPGHKWLKRSAYIVLALAVVGGGLYGGYRWTQTQYFVGSNEEHVALYRGISQDLAWVSLSKVREGPPRDRTQVPPSLPAKQVEDTIAEGNLGGARTKIDELAAQATACKKDEQRRAAEPRGRQGRRGEAGGPRAPDLPAAEGHRHQHRRHDNTTNNKPESSDSHSGPQPLGGRAEAGLECAVSSSRP